MARPCPADPPAHRSGRQPAGDRRTSADDRTDAPILPISARLERTFAARLAEQPSDTKALLLVLAADVTCPLSELLTAGERLTGPPPSTSRPRWKSPKPRTPYSCGSRPTSRTVARNTARRRPKGRTRAPPSSASSRTVADARPNRAMWRIIATSMLPSSSSANWRGASISHNARSTSGYAARNWRTA